MPLAFPALYACHSPSRKADGSYDWATELEFGWSMVDRQSVGSFAAFIMGPILSTGGILDSPPGYLKRMVEECKERNMPVVMDEVQTGIGCTGQILSFERHDIESDILCLSKTSGCGLLLVSISTTLRIESGCRGTKVLWLTTHLNDPLTAAVGNMALEIVERDSICERVRDRGERSRVGLNIL